MKLTLWTAFWVALLDQLSKFAVVEWLNLAEVGRIEVWSPFLEFRMAWNYGINFGLFAGDDTRWPLIGLSLVIMGFVLWWIYRDGGNRLTLVSAGLLLGGALGNVIDRLHYEAVADFLNMSCCGLENPYAFNVADIAIFVGAVGLVIFGGGSSK